MDHWLKHLHPCKVLGGRSGKETPHSASLWGLTNKGRQISLMGLLDYKCVPKPSSSSGPPKFKILYLAYLAGSGGSPREGYGSPLQYSCLENPMDRGAWWATVHGITRVGHDLATKPPPPPPCILVKQTNKEKEEK